MEALSHKLQRIAWHDPEAIDVIDTLADRILSEIVMKAKQGH